jgi:hypothetical protein
VRKDVTPTSLAARVDRELDADRNFFKHNPRRRYYVRRMLAAERAQFESKLKRSLTPPEGDDNFVAVEQLFPGARRRVHFQAPAALDVGGLDEALSAEFFQACTHDGVVRIAS